MEKEKTKKLIITFKGDKIRLSKQLKLWCAEAERSMGGLVVELIENYLSKQNKPTKNSGGQK